MDIRARQADGQGEALTVNEEVQLAPSLAPVCGVGPGVRSTTGCGNADGVQRRAGPVQAPVLLRIVEQDAPMAHPHAPTLPLVEAALAGPSASQPQGHR